MNSRQKERMIALERAYLRDRANLIDKKAKIYAQHLPQITVYDNGKTKTVYHFTPKASAALKIIDEALAHLTSSYKQEMESIT